MKGLDEAIAGLVQGAVKAGLDAAQAAGLSEAEAQARVATVLRSEAARVGADVERIDAALAASAAAIAAGAPT